MFNFFQGPIACETKIKAVVTSVPVEECEMTPQKRCRQTTKLVPQLKSKKECVEVPRWTQKLPFVISAENHDYFHFCVLREVCALSRVNPRIQKTPFIKKWCYTPQCSKSNPCPENKSCQNYKCVKDDEGI